MCTLKVVIASVAILTAGLQASTVSASPDFFAAVRQDDYAAVERFLAEGVSPRMRTAALIHATSREMVNALLAAGAKLDAPIRDGGHALHTAAHEGNTEVVRALIAAGADIHARSRPHRFTPLLSTVWRGSRATPETARALIEAGADVNAATPYGVTVLHFAVKYGRDPAMIDLLLDAGADPLARLKHHIDALRGDDGRTPLYVARKYNPRILRTDAGRRLQAATRRMGMDEPGCDGVVVQPSDTKLSLLAERTLGRESRWREIVELNGLEGKGYRAGDCLALP